MTCRFKTIFALCLFVIFLILPGFSFAENGVRIITPVVKTGERSELPLLKQSSGTAEMTAVSPFLNKKIDTLVQRIQAAVERAENIAERISNRLSKIQKTNSKAKKLSTRYASISKQVEKLKKELKKTEDFSSKLLKNPEPEKEFLIGYQLFRKQVISINALLADIYIAEKNLIVAMKPYASPAGVATATAVPKK